MITFPNKSCSQKKKKASHCGASFFFTSQATEGKKFVFQNSGEISTEDVKLTIQLPLSKSSKLLFILQAIYYFKHIIYKFLETTTPQ